MRCPFLEKVQTRLGGFVLDSETQSSSKKQRQERTTTQEKLKQKVNQKKDKRTRLNVEKASIRKKATKSKYQDKNRLKK
jgi:hypothetical protein